MNTQTNILTTTYAPGTLTEQQIGEIWAKKARAGGNRKRMPVPVCVRPGITRTGRQKSESFDRIELLLRKNGPLPSYKIAELAHLSPNTVKDYLSTMTTAGRLVRYRFGRGSRYRVAV